MGYGVVDDGDMMVYMRGYGGVYDGDMVVYMMGIWWCI